MNSSPADTPSTSKLMTGMGLDSSINNKQILQLYIPHRPAMEIYQNLNGIHTLNNGDIEGIIQACGNHWRKIFVIFAKIAAAIDKRQLPWKIYLQEHLLQSSGSERLIFCEETMDFEDNTNLIHLFSGKACGETASYDKFCEEIATGFYQHRSESGFITPYFDYRQLSNVKIDFLVAQIQQLQA